MKRYTFYITIIGDGEDVDKAWNDAVEGFIADPGIAPDDDLYQVEEFDEEEP